MKALIVWRGPVVKSAGELESAARASRSSFSFAVAKRRASGQDRPFVKVQGLDASNQAELQVEVARVLRAVRSLKRRFPGAIRRSEIDIGVFVGADESFAPSIRLIPRLMISAAEMNVEVVISCYPTEG